MEIDLEKRQQIERNYHNAKYENDAVSLNYNHSNCAYDFYQGLINQISIGKILDFGCGNGWLSMSLATHGHDVYGIDISSELVKKARKWAQDIGVTRNAHFDEMTGENLLFEDNFFDAVVGSAVLHHTDLERALDGIHRVLKPGGKGLFIEPLNQNILLRLWRFLTPWRRSSAEKALTKSDLITIKEKFPLSKLRYFYFISMLSIAFSMVLPASKFLNRIILVFEKLDEVLLERFPKLETSCAVVVMELIKDQG